MPKDFINERDIVNLLCIGGVLALISWIFGLVFDLGSIRGATKDPFLKVFLFFSANAWSLSILVSVLIVVIIILIRVFRD